MSADWTDSDMTRYTCRRAAGPILVDGKLDEPSWRNAPRSPRFVDMITGRPGFMETRAAALWDDEAFYVGFWIEEPFVEARLTERDATIFQENDVEVFIDGGDCYYEFEINAKNTIYEVLFIWQDAYLKKFRTPEFDVFARHAYTFGGNHDRDARTFWRGTHPRGLRWAFTDWDFPGLRSAVRVDGRLNDDGSVDKGWTVELAFPWAGMAHLAGGRSLPPKDGDEWRIFFGRFGKLAVGEAVVSPAFSWGRIGDGDNHIPERFTRVTFSERPVDPAPPAR
ncbi:MAG: carbohydrate-binding family 9-like protein [Candidatus Aminicenantes bacterium]|nr:carbohydrate-binding family 9-like protein [Candidatus Aminicenantes bacterium]